MDVTTNKFYGMDPEHAHLYHEADMRHAERLSKTPRHAGKMTVHKSIQDYKLICWPLVKEFRWPAYADIVGHYPKVTGFTEPIFCAYQLEEDRMGWDGIDRVAYIHEPVIGWIGASNTSPDPTVPKAPVHTLHVDRFEWLGERFRMAYCEPLDQLFISKPFHQAV